MSGLLSRLPLFSQTTPATPKPLVTAGFETTANYAEYTNGDAPALRGWGLTIGPRLNFNLGHDLALGIAPVFRHQALLEFSDSTEGIGRSNLFFNGAGLKFSFDVDLAKYLNLGVSAGFYLGDHTCFTTSGALLRIVDSSGETIAGGSPAAPQGCVDNEFGERVLPGFGGMMDLTVQAGVNLGDSGLTLSGVAGHGFKFVSTRIPGDNRTATESGGGWALGINLVGAWDFFSPAPPTRPTGSGESNGGTPGSGNGNPPTDPRAEILNRQERERVERAKQQARLDAASGEWRSKINNLLSEPNTRSNLGEALFPNLQPKTRDRILDNLKPAPISEIVASPDAVLPTFSQMGIEVTLGSNKKGTLVRRDEAGNLEIVNPSILTELAAGTKTATKTFALEVQSVRSSSTAEGAQIIVAQKSYLNTEGGAIAPEGFEPKLEVRRQNTEGARFPIPTPEQLAADETQIGILSVNAARSSMAAEQVAAKKLKEQKEAILKETVGLYELKIRSGQVATASTLAVYQLENALSAANPADKERIGGLLKTAKANQTKSLTLQKEISDLTRQLADVDGQVRFRLKEAEGEKGAGAGKKKIKKTEKEKEKEKEKAGGPINVDDL